jgi:hypothetical protein
MAVEVIDPVADYAAPDGDAVRLRRPIRAAVGASGLTMAFDAMHARHRPLRPSNAGGTPRLRGLAR